MTRRRRKPTRGSRPAAKAKKAAARGDRRFAAADEPAFEDEELAWCGDQLIYVIDRTPAGFAYGPTIADLRRDSERSARSAGWARAKYVLRELIAREVAAVSDVGWVKKIGEGCSRDIFAAEVEFADGRSDTYVVALPRRDAEPALDDRTTRELRLVARLCGRQFPFRIPEMVGAFPDGERVGAFPDRERVGAFPDRERVGAFPDRERVGAFADEERVGAFDDEEGVGAFDDEERVGAFDDEERVGVFDDEERVGAFDDEERVGAFADEERVGAFADEERVGAFDDEEVVGAFDDEERVGAFDDEERVGAFADEERVGAFADEERVGAFADEERVGAFADAERVGAFADERVGAFADRARLALVRRFAPGIELDARAGRQTSVRPWQIIGEIAAAVHAVPAAEVADIVPGAASRRDHAREAIAVLAGPGPSEFGDAHAWALAHLPPAEPSRLLHGDLRGQNILLSLDGPHHVIDWEYARTGDPAYDLAIVTRGVVRPFQIDRGLERLLEAYRGAGGCPVTVADVRVYELCMIAERYRAAVSDRGPADHELACLRSVLRRLG